MHSPRHTMLMFPGQGSQAAGMVADFPAHAPSRHLLEEASDTLGLNLIALMGPGADEATLRQTEHAQPALLAMGYVAASYLLEQSGRPLDAIAAMVAGHSVGEYTAATVAGAINFPTALRLVQTRARAMAGAVPAGQGGMAAVIGLAAPALHAALAGVGGIHMANDNAEGQIIISGTTAALDEAEALLKGAGAKRVLRLNVSGPFHTPAMQPAAAAVKAFLAEHPLQKPAVPLMSNAVAEPLADPAALATALVQQITAPVRWREGMQNAAEQGIRQALELGPGKVLSGLAPRCDERLAAQSLSSRQAIDAWLQANL